MCLYKLTPALPGSWAAPGRAVCWVGGCAPSTGPPPAPPAGSTAWREEGRVEGAAEGEAVRNSSPLQHWSTKVEEEERERERWRFNIQLVSFSITETDELTSKQLTTVSAQITMTTFRSILVCVCVCVDTHPCSVVLELCLLLDGEVGGSGIMPPSSGNPGNRNLQAKMCGT